MYYVVEVSTKPIEEKINRVWEVDVCTFFPEGPVTHTTSLPAFRFVDLLICWEFGELNQG